MKKMLPYVIFIAVVAGIAWGILKIQEAQFNEKFKDFQPYLEQYVQAGDKTLPAIDSPHRSMKLIVLSSSLTKPYQFDKMNLNLPDSIRAKTPAEVNTVVQIDRSEEAIGKYSDGSYGYLHKALIYVVDVETNRVINMYTFRGSSPPDTKSGGGDAYGSLPDDEIIQYLEKLAKD